MTAVLLYDIVPVCTPPNHAVALTLSPLNRNNPMSCVMLVLVAVVVGVVAACVGATAEGPLRAASRPCFQTSTVRSKLHHVLSLIFDSRHFQSSSSCVLQKHFGQHIPGGTQPRGIYLLISLYSFYVFFPSRYVTNCDHRQILA